MNAIEDDKKGEKMADLSHETIEQLFFEQMRALSV